jgi:hypothetical protein
MNVQHLRFDNGDRKAYLDALLTGKNIGSGKWIVYLSKGCFFLAFELEIGFRSQLNFVEVLTDTDARWLNEERHIEMSSPHRAILEAA